MGSRVERIPIDCLSLGGTPLIPEVTELSYLPKRAKSTGDLSSIAYSSNVFFFLNSNTIASESFTRTAYSIPKPRKREREVL
jgi:hypothetical protein